MVPLGAAPEWPKPVIQKGQRMPQASASAHVLCGQKHGPASSHRSLPPVPVLPPGRHRVRPQSPVHHCCMGWMGFVSNLNGVRRQSFGVCIGLWTTPDKPVVNGIPLLLLSDLQPTMKQSYNKDMGLPHSLTLSRRPAFLSSVLVSTEKKTFTKNSPVPVDYSPL